MFKTMYENPLKTVIFAFVAGSVAEGCISAARGMGVVTLRPIATKKKAAKKKTIKK